MPTPDWCDEHWMTLPCGGCRADRLVTGMEHIGARDSAIAALNDCPDIKDARQLAAGDD